MDPISSVSSIYAISKHTAAALREVRWWINASKKLPKVLEDLDVCLGTLAARLSELALLFQDGAGVPGTRIMLTLSTFLHKIQKGLEQVWQISSNLRLRLMPARDAKIQPPEESMVELEKPLNELLLVQDPLSELVRTVNGVAESRKA